MSFLNSVLSSIETGDVPHPPAKDGATADSSSTSVAEANTVSSKTGRKQTAPSQRVEQTSSAQKRKADYGLHGTDGREKAARPSPIRPTSASNIKQPNGPSTTPAESDVARKPPPKGSYADMMAQAKALQSKVPTNLGTIRHQTTQKERRSKVQQKRLAKESKQRGEESKAHDKANETNRNSVGGTGKFRDTKLRSPATSAEPKYKGTARPPSEPASPAYKGTAGRPSARGSSGKEKSDRKAQSRPSRMDEYLGTDEEDEGGYEEADYASDESTDMEAGVMDMEGEEQAALRIAKEEDERELQMEMEAKKEKLARKKKLQQLATKTRR